MMVPVLDTLLRSLQKQRFGDFVDQLNSFYTSIILLFCAVLVSARQIVGAPIECWTPQEFHRMWEQYAESYCYMQNTYYIPISKEIPLLESDRNKKKILYYQWVSLMLVIQALLFYLPNAIWNLLSWHCGFDGNSIIKMAITAKVPNEQRRKLIIKNLAKYIADTLELSKNVPFRGCGERRTCLTVLYLFTKTLYTFNVVLQFCILSKFLGVNYLSWGIETFNDISSGREWHETGNFPRVTLCDFKVRKLGTVQEYTVQCVLMINMFNEKVFITLWGLFVIVGLCTFVNLVWLVVCCTKWIGIKSIHRYLSFSTENVGAAINIFIVEKFSKTFLRPDGILLLRFIGLQVGDLIAAETTFALYDIYARQTKLHPRTNANGKAVPAFELIQEIVL